MRVLCVIVLLVCLASAKEHKGRKHERKHERHHVVDQKEAKEALDALEYNKEMQVRFRDDEWDESQEYSSEEEREEEREEEEEEKIRGYANDVDNPCAEFDCPLGMMCAIDGYYKPYCTCVQECLDEQDEDYFICDTNNITYHSDCEFYRIKCADADMADVELDYYGSCRFFPECDDEELTEFPLRMRDWFVKVMKQLAEWPAEEGGLTDSERELEREAEDDEKRYLKPVHWKFRSMDIDPVDKYLTQRELADLRAPLQRLEHCTKPFLEMCDEDGDGLVSIIEWGTCLLLESDEIEY